MNTPVRSDKKNRLRLLILLEAWLEAPMFLLALLWLWLFIIEFTRGLSAWQQALVTAIWIAFILEFAIKLILAPRKLQHLKKNLITLVALLVPALRVFRLLRALRILRSMRIVSTTRFVRALTSTSRLVKDIREAQGEAPSPEVNVGVLLMLSPTADREAMVQFSRQLEADVNEEINSATATPWIFHPPREFSLEDERPRRPSEFLDEASRHMAEGPYDIVLTLTDVALLSRRNQMESGLFSTVTHLVCLSTYGFSRPARGQPPRPLNVAAVRWNAAALLLHLLGHIAGLRHAAKGGSDLMTPFSYRENRQALPRFSEAERQILRRNSRDVPERELRDGGLLGSLFFHILMAVRHPMAVLRPLLHGRSLLMSLSLPGLTTAAVAPALLLVFTAEIWDVGLNMSNWTAAIFATASVVGASFYLVSVQSLFLPRQEKRTVTEHLAIANSVIFLSVILACFGLFLLVVSLILLIEFFVFPEGLMQTWPTLDQPEITFLDQLRLAIFISTVGVTTGALAGGLDKRTVIQHMALFQEMP